MSCSSHPIQLYHPKNFRDNSSVEDSSLLVCDTVLGKWCHTFQSTTVLVSSEVRSPTIILDHLTFKTKAKQSSTIWGTTHPMTYYHIPEDMYLQLLTT
jgi:hypothetical protein